MDELQIQALINKSKLLKHRFMGVFAADNFPQLVKNSFQIVNASGSHSYGSHWTLMCMPMDGKVIFADPLGLELEIYQTIFRRCLTMYNAVINYCKHPIQPDSSNACGLYCIFYAHTIFSRRYPDVLFIGEVDLNRFVKHMY